jgi:hypothetical protein
MLSNKRHPIHRFTAGIGHRIKGGALNGFCVSAALFAPVCKTLYMFERGHAPNLSKGSGW